MDHRDAEAINAAIRTVGIRHRSRAAALLADVGLHPGQETLLLDLDVHGPRTQAQLAVASGCEPPVVTVTARKLEAAGLIARRPSTTDRRATVVELTPRGRAVVEEVRSIYQRLAEETVAGLRRTGARELLDVLTDLAGSLCRGREGFSCDGSQETPPANGGGAG
ncbi:DNA-binding MarR family transcriptional regulator [Kineococcus xinjiangensis]|uniref:DNA-binding MarR family transcriptional regulator n=1 Tax=Kineococcus xinjiangensis TaxID=512762 RepID=A0A2S6IVG2_9ACTN|nr:MarR family transcriptional regulator [Kineococcus xinjiangensis]PPK98352.1 DNA-binding MarR family transcriptional regulator [Kineococcus xinjiangensis]